MIFTPLVQRTQDFVLSRLSFHMTIRKSWQGKSVGNLKRQGTGLTPATQACTVWYMVLLKVLLNSFPLNGCTLGFLPHIVRKFVTVVILFITLLPLSAPFLKSAPPQVLFLKKNMHPYFNIKHPLPMSALP